MGECSSVHGLIQGMIISLARKEADRFHLLKAGGEQGRMA